MRDLENMWEAMSSLSIFKIVVLIVVLPVSSLIGAMITGAISGAIWWGVFCCVNTFNIPEWAEFFNMLFMLLFGKFFILTSIVFGAIYTPYKIYKLIFGE